jgi:hypothetical protein
MKEINLNDFLGYKWTDLYWKKFEIEYSIESLEKISNNQEEKLGNLKFELDKKVNEISEKNKNLDGEYLNQLIYHLTFADGYLNDFIEKTQRNYLISAIFSLIEVKLRELCILIDSEFVLDKKLSEMKADKGYLNLYLNYLEKVYNICINRELNRIINKIYELKNIRNTINHQDSIVNINDKKILENIEGLDYKIFEDKIYFHFLNDTYIKNSLKLTLSFFNILFTEVDRVYIVRMSKN